jgi:phosphoesterase RecJ-like protein
VLDHHLGEAAFAELAYVTPQACATGELVYDFVRRHPEAWTRPLAEALYTALVTDTGSFHFSNTDPAAHAMAAHLLELGVRPEPLVAIIYQHRHPDRLRFIGEVLRGLELTPDGGIAWLTIERETMRRFQVDGADTEGLVDFPRTIPGVEAVALFTETADGGVKVSFRSAGSVDVDAVARSFGGGGHRAAAGATVAGPLAEARQRVLARLGEEVGRARTAAAGRG